MHKGNGDTLTARFRKHRAGICTMSDEPISIQRYPLVDIFMTMNLQPLDFTRSVVPRRRRNRVVDSGR